MEREARAVTRPDSSVVAQAADSSFNMKVMDAFKITGRGVVLTGRIESGHVSAGDSVCLSAARIGTQSLKVESIEIFRKIVTTAKRGDMVAILVNGINAGDITRGSDTLSADCGHAGANQERPQVQKSSSRALAANEPRIARPCAIARASNCRLPACGGQK